MSIQSAFSEHSVGVQRAFVIFGRLPPGADVRANWKDPFSVKNFAMCERPSGLGVAIVDVGLRHSRPSH